MSEKMELADENFVQADEVLTDYERGWRAGLAHMQSLTDDVLVKACADELEIEALKARVEDLKRRNAAALRASPAEGEAVAWTNEAQLGFLKEPGYRVVPMAMWAFWHSAHPVALYTAPPRAAVSPPQRVEVASVQYGADFLMVELDKLGMNITWTACKKIVEGILALYPAGDGREADSLPGEN